MHTKQFERSVPMHSKRQLTLLRKHQVLQSMVALPASCAVMRMAGKRNSAKYRVAGREDVCMDFTMQDGAPWLLMMLLVATGTVSKWKAPMTSCSKKIILTTLTECPQDVAIQRSDAVTNAEPVNVVSLQQQQCYIERCM